MRMPVIELNSVSKYYGTTTAIEGISLKVEEGSIFGFLGPNGAGKTTTIKIIMGLRKQSSGEVFLWGKKTTGRNIELLKRIGYVPENESIYDTFSLFELINIVKPYYPTWDSKLESVYQDKFELPLKKRIGEFSLGMKRKTLLLLALCFKPDLLVLDDPTLGLDPLTRYKFLQLLVDTVASEKQTVFLSSHVLGEVERVCDTIALLKKGKLLDIKKMEELKSEDKLFRIVFQRELTPGELSIPGLEIVESKGKFFLIKIRQNPDEVLEKLQKFPIFVIEEQEISLEDIFVNKMEDK
ncbi:MAG: ABC transporter ATP-binding protein YtrB [candidate division WS2 bacterium]|nr:ABC transporter ATP-binding protein YtrB [Candidatus Lithacetigena glycinireducens]